MIKKKIVILLGILAFFLVVFLAKNNQSYKEESKILKNLSLTMYKTPTCDCCTRYAEYLIKKGAKVEIKVISDYELEKLKKELSIPKQLFSCHTSIVNGKIIEGHVPAEIIVEFLEKSKENFWKGLSLPEMPIGSPGMDGPKLQKFVFYVFNKNETKIFKEV